MFVTTDENGRLKMLPLRTRSKQHDDGSRLVCKCQPSAASSSTPSSPGGGSFASPAAPQAKPMVPRRILPHPDTSHPLVSPATQPLAGHIQNASNTLPEPRVPVVPTVPVVSTQCSNTKHRVPTWPTHIRLSQLVSSLPVRAPAPAHRRAGWVNRRTSPPLRRVLQPL
jgi:hypothetical protein